MARHYLGTDTLYEHETSILTQKERKSLLPPDNRNCPPPGSPIDMIR